MIHKTFFVVITLFILQFSNAQTPGNSLDFDGIDDYVVMSLPAVFNSIDDNDFTIEAWVKPTDTLFSRIIFAQLNPSRYVNIAISPSGQISFYVNGGDGVRSTSSLIQEEWTHVACTWEASSSIRNIYINGVLEENVSAGGSTTGSDNLMTVGARTDGIQTFTGELDELRIWDDIRTPCEIAFAMNSEFSTTQPNLITYYNFNHGIPSGDNPTVTILSDLTTTYDGTLLNFDLSGENSNWLASTADITKLNESGISVTLEVETFFSNISGATYQWLDCDNEHAVIPGATNQNYTATENGSYAVEVTINDCIDTSDCYSITDLSVSQSFLSEEVSIYPNPSEGKFMVDLGRVYKSSKISVKSLDGKIIQSEEYYNVDLINLNLEVPKGIYLLYIESDDEKAIMKLVKK